MQKIRVFAALIYNQIRNRTVTVSNNVMLCSYLYTPLLERILDIKEVLYTNSSYSKSSAVYIYVSLSTNLALIKTHISWRYILLISVVDEKYVPLSLKLSKNQLTPDYNCLLQKNLGGEIASFSHHRFSIKKRIHTAFLKL